MASPAWQRKEGKSASGGLNKKGVASYRRANPGSKLQTAVTTKPSKLKKGSKASNRRKSFCARMSGMKKRLTSAKTANDPNSSWVNLTSCLRLLYLVFMRDSKKLESFLKEKELKDKQLDLLRNLKKEVEIGANGTQKYIIKKGENKGKVAEINAIRDSNK
jgi:hypothetical protein